MRWTRYARRAPSLDVAPVAESHGWQERRVATVAEPRRWRLCLTVVLVMLPLILAGCLSNPRQPGAADGNLASVSTELNAHVATDGTIVRTSMSGPLVPADASIVTDPAVASVTMAQSGGPDTITSSEPDTSSLNPVKA